MPYAIRKIRNQNKYKVINTQTQEVHAKGTTKPKAEAQVRILNEYEKKRR